MILSGNDTVVGQPRNQNGTNNCFQCWNSLVFEKGLPELTCIHTYMCVCIYTYMSFSL